MSSQRANSKQVQDMNTLKRYARSIAIALAAAAFYSAPIQAQVKPIEAAIETSTDAVLLPASDAGTIVFEQCEPPCAMRSVKLVDTSTYYVGGHQVSYREFAEFVRTSEPQFLMIFHEPGKPLVTRLVVYGQLPR